MSSPTFAAAVEAGRQRFEAGAFYAAHEVWESGWRRVRGAEKHVLQALVLWSAGVHHHEQHNEMGARRLLLRALERLSQVKDDFAEVDVEGLREGLVTSLEHVQAQWSDEARPAWPQSFGLSGTESLEHQARCPYCGEHVLVQVAPEEAHDASYVEDCPVCCRPWQVQLSRFGEHSQVSLGRDDAQ